MKVAISNLAHPHGMAYLETLISLESVETVFCTRSAAANVEPVLLHSPKVELLESIDPLTITPDAVLLADAPSRMPGLAEDWMRTKTAVLVEKPGARTATELSLLVARAADHGTTLAVSYPMRCNPVAEAVSRHVVNGDLGRLTGFEARWLASRVRYRDPSHWLFRKEASGGGILHWLGCHLIDLISWTTGEKIEAVGCMSATVDGEPISVEDVAVLTIRLSNGALGTLRVGYQLDEGQPGYLLGSYDTYFALNGTSGTIKWNFTKRQDGTGTYRLNDRDICLNIPPKPGYSGFSGWEFLRRWIESVETRTLPPATGAQGVEVLRVIDSAYQASRERRLIEVD